MRAQEKQTVHSTYDMLKSLVEERIDLALARVEPATLRNAMQHGAYGGKMIRPIITMLSCGAVGGKETSALVAATAIELLHTSSLIHDDIMDNSPLRRGVPTIHTTFDIPMGILAGDTFVALAFQMMQSLHSPNKDRITQTFVNSFRNVCEGQGFDLCLTRYECSQPDIHRRMVEKKTAKLLEAASAIGALIGTINEEHIAALRRYGHNLGMAFQAQDDVLDATGNAEVMGKPACVDTKNCRHTFLTLAYPNTEVDALDALIVARGAINDYTGAAISALETLPPTEARELLHTLAESLTKRQE
jgi:geranylgeranyl diphosphate synthase type I